MRHPLPRRLAAVDIGSNTVHALVADVRKGELHDVAQFVEMPELGPAVDSAGRIGPAKTAEALKALDSVLSRAREHGYEHLVAGATAAIRRAADREEFLTQASAAAGVPVRLIAEDREAELSFQGVASRHASRHGWLMGDMGGSSTELVVAHAPECEAHKLVMTGGTASNLPLVLSQANPPSVLTTTALLTAAERLDAAQAAVVAARVGLPEARVRAMRGGVELLLLLLDFYGLDRFHVSHEGLRQGMLLAWLDRGEDWWR